MTATSYYTISDGTTTIKCLGNPDFKPWVHPIGAVYFPLDYDYATMSSDKSRKGITLTMIALDTTTEEPTQAADLALWDMLTETVQLTITWPDGVTTMNVMIDKQTDPISSAQYSLFNWAYMNTWTVKLYQVAA